MTERTGTWRARPFVAKPRLSNLPNPFPTPDQLRDALRNGTRGDREIFVRLWLSEGVPFSFRNCPALFEDLRGWLGNRLDVHPKEITLIGSGRIGFSLAGGIKYGKEFGDDSDLDFSVVSHSLFSLLTQSYYQYVDDYYSRRIVPSGEKEAELWKENINVCGKNIRRGFLDVNKIPNRRSYPVVRNIMISMWFLDKRLKETPEAPPITHSSVRIYRCWSSFIDQVSLNLCYVLKDEDAQELTTPSREGNQSSHSNTES